MENETVKNDNKQKVSVNGNEIHYEKVGNGDHIVLLMQGDFGESRIDFIPQFKGMDKDKFTLIAWDPPGIGFSRPPERDFNNFFRKDAETAAELMKALGIDKYSVMGSGDGGITGMILSATYPDNVNKLVIWGVKAYMTDEDREYFTSIRGEWNTEIKQNYINVYGKELFKKLWNSYLDCYIQYDDICKDDLKRIKCPTFIFHGHYDTYILREHTKFLSKNIKNVKMHGVFNGGHAIHYKYPLEFNRLVQEFLLQK